MKISVACVLALVAFSYFGNSSLSARLKVDTSGCDAALNDQNRFIVWHDLNTVYSFFKPYVFYKHGEAVYQFRTDSGQSLICYKFEVLNS